MDWIDRIWDWTAWVLLASAVSLFTWAMLSDRVRRWRASRRGESTRRCPRCWYDMHGVIGLRCPECGKAAASEKRLARSRIRWRGIAIAATLLAPAWVAAKMPEVRVGGWGRLVPVAALAMMANDLNDWHNGLRMDWATKQLLERRAVEMPGWLGERVLAWRLARHWREKSEREGRGWEVAVIDTSGLTGNSVILSERPRSPAGWSGGRIAIDARQGFEYVSIANTSSFKRALQYLVSPESWRDHADEGGRMREAGDRIVIACSPAILADIRSLIASLQTAHTTITTLDRNEVTIVGSELLPAPSNERPADIAERLNDLSLALEAIVDSDRPGRSRSAQLSVDVVLGRLLIRGPLATRERCLDLLRTLRACNPEAPYHEFNDTSLLLLDGLLKVIPPDERRWEVERPRLRAVADLCTSMVNQDAWESMGGNLASIRVVPNAVLAIRGDPDTRRRAVAFVETLLATIEDGKPRRLVGGPRRFDWDSRIEHVAVWPVRQALEAWGAMSEAQAMLQIGAPDPTEDPSWLRFEIESVRSDSEAKAAFRLIQPIWELIPAVDEERALPEIFSGVLVFWTTEPELIDRVEALLPELAKGPPVKLDNPAAD